MKAKMVIVRHTSCMKASATEFSWNFSRKWSSLSVGRRIDTTFASQAETWEQYWSPGEGIVCPDSSTSSSSQLRSRIREK
jgi:hypothetical protein